MPNEVWYVLIAAVLIAVVFAILKGSGLILRKGKDGVEIEVKKRSAAIPPKTGISVGEGARIEGSTVGNIGGIIHRGGGTVPVPAGAEIDVLRQGELKDVQARDIGGVVQDDGLEAGK
ncbi:MAG TPA: hypothetical protein VGG03_03345 [Thermoanaerobaculia bacterium]|jgi:hypothetical protein